MTDSRLALLRDLVRADEAHAAAVGELDELVSRTAALRARADELAAVLAAAPAERQRLDAEVALAEAEARRRAVALAEAERELAAVEAGKDEERRAASRRSCGRARDALAAAEQRLAACRRERLAFEARIDTAEREAPEVEASAAALAESLGGRPRLARDAGLAPQPGLAGVSAWASGARAALLVARGGVASERDAVIRQANELASAILGEPLVAAGAGAIARRVEQALGV